LNVGLPNFTLQRMQYTEREYAKTSAHKILLLLPTCYSDTDTQGSQELIQDFLLRQFNIEWFYSHLSFFTKWWAKIFNWAGNHLFLS